VRGGRARVGRVRGAGTGKLSQIHTVVERVQNLRVLGRCRQKFQPAQSSTSSSCMMDVTSRDEHG